MIIKSRVNKGGGHHLKNKKRILMRKKRLKLQDFLSVDSDHIYIRVFNYTASGDCQD